MKWALLAYLALLVATAAAIGTGDGETRAVGREIFPEATRRLTEAELTISNGRCTVSWYGDPRYGDWLYTLECKPDPEAAAIQAAANRVAASLRRHMDRPWVQVWPEHLWGAVAIIDACESNSSWHPDTYLLDGLHGGRMQIDPRTWRTFFENEHGWTWWEIVNDDVINSRAGYVIYQRAGSFRPWPWCGRAYY